MLRMLRMLRFPSGPEREVAPPGVVEIGARIASGGGGPDWDSL